MVGQPLTVAGSVRRAGVLGHPIAHSLSPVLHRAAYAQLGLDWTYEAFDVDAAGLPGFLAACDDTWAGLSLTMPLKRAVVPLLDEASDLVRLTGAANTVVLGPHGRSGHNTDVAGIVEALRGIDAHPGPALIIGAGATAASALVALAELGCPRVLVLARRRGAGDELGPLACAVGVHLDVRDWSHELPGREAAAMVVCTVPADASTPLVDAVPGAPGALLDVSYHPWPPPLVVAWRRAGGRAVAGDEMLLHQAAAQVRLMTGLAPEVAAMRAALHAEVAARA